jgi:hypothetical protein
MPRRATGYARSPYNINQQGASDRAALQARRRLEALNRTSDPVPCPDCGWFNADALDAAKRNSWKWSPWGQGRGVDPNKGYPLNRGHFPGMPTPIRIAAGVRPGKPPLGLYPPQEEPGGHITIHPQRDRLPDICCACLEPTDHHARLQVTSVRIPPLDYAICKTCDERYTRKTSIFVRCTFAIAVLLVAAIAYPFVSRQFPRDPDVVFILVAGVGACVGLIAGALILLFARRWMPSPIYLSAYDDTRHLYRIRFVNPAFIQRVQTSVAGTPLPHPMETDPDTAEAVRDDDTLPLL